MSEAAIRAQIKTVLEAVSGIGAVHDYERYPRSLGDFFLAMTSGSPSKVNGWVIHRESTRSSRVTLGVNGQIERVHVFKITGFYQLDDADGSEKDFQALLDAVFDEFKEDSGLGGTAFRSDLLQVENVTVTSVDEMGADLYHIAECSLSVYERISA
jgi:hypothetical protein